MAINVLHVLGEVIRPKTPIIVPQPVGMKHSLTLEDDTMASQMDAWTVFVLDSRPKKVTAWRASEAEEIARVASAFTDEEERMTEDGNGSMTLESRMVQDGASTPLRRLVDDLEGTMDEALEGVRRVTFGPDQYATMPVTNNLTIEDDVMLPSLARAPMRGRSRRALRA